MQTIAALPLVPPSVPVHTRGRVVPGGHLAVGLYVLALVGAIALWLVLAGAYGWAVERLRYRESVQRLDEEVEAMLRDPLRRL
jgi:hypothetical protein